MKVKYKVGKGKAVLEFSGDESLTLEQALEIAKDPDTIQITITKMTTREYLKKAGAVNG
nr:hypothetical protein [uncultured Oscillibacter sp.]